MTPTCDFQIITSKYCIAKMQVTHLMCFAFIGIILLNWNSCLTGNWILQTTSKNTTEHWRTTPIISWNRALILIAYSNCWKIMNWPRTYLYVVLSVYCVLSARVMMMPQCVINSKYWYVRKNVCSMLSSIRQMTQSKEHVFICKDKMYSI